MRRQRGSRLLGLTLGVAVVVAGCGGDDDAGLGNQQTGASGPEEGTSTSANGNGGNILEGDWQATPGQADTVETTLSDMGYECSADSSLDIRMCAKGVETSDPISGSDVTMGRLRFLADGEGTVVMAAIDGDTATITPPEWFDMETEMVEAVLPPEDAAVLLADGTTLQWGSVEVDQADPDNSLLRIDGFVPPSPYVPESSPFETTPEAALSALQSAGLECNFEDQPSTGPGASSTEPSSSGAQPHLSCLDPSFTSENEDGSIEGATAEAILAGGTEGTTQLTVEARHGSIPDDMRGVEQLVPKVVGAIDEEPLADIQTWVADHLDAVPHSAYIGSWQVVLYVAPNSMLGDSVGVVVTPEPPDFGFSAS